MVVCLFILPKTEALLQQEMASSVDSNDRASDTRDADDSVSFVEKFKTSTPAELKDFNVFEVFLLKLKPIFASKGFLQFKKHFYLIWLGGAFLLLMLIFLTKPTFDN